MKPLDNQIVLPVELTDLAEAVVDTVLLGMRVIRTEMRVGFPVELSIPQFRMLAFLERHSGTSLSALANHAGLTLPSMSKMVDGLVKRGLISREASSEDRRCVNLGLTESGAEAFAAAKEIARSRLASMLDAIPQKDRTIIIKAMQSLKPIFSAHKLTTRCSR